MRDYLVYLAGPIAGADYHHCVGWRDDATKRLAPDIQTLSPMRSKTYYAPDEIQAKPGCWALRTPKGITARDRNDVMRCDVMLAYFGFSESISIGTCIEIGWADMLRKPVVLVALDSHPMRSHPMVRECVDFIAVTLDEAVTVIRGILLP